MKFSAKSQQNINPNKYLGIIEMAIRDAFHRQSKNGKYFLGQVIAYRIRDWFLHASQKTVASWQGCCEKTINRNSFRLEEGGLLIVERAPRNSRITNWYSLPSFFYDRRFRKIIRKYVPSIRKLAIYQNVRQLINPSSSLYNNENINIKNEEFFSQKRSKMGEAFSLSRHLQDFNNPKPSNSEKVAQKPREYSVHPAGCSPTCPAMLSLKPLNLTKWGQITLSAYPEEAIKHASSKMTHVMASSSPFKYFEALCKEWCITHKTPPDFQSAQTLASQYGMPADANMQLRQIVNMPETFPFEQNSPTMAPSTVKFQQPQTSEPMYNFQDDSEYNKKNFLKGEKVSRSTPYNPHAGVHGITPTKIWHEERRPKTEAEKTEIINKLIEASDGPGSIWLKKFIGEESVNKLLTRVIESTLNS